VAQVRPFIGNDRLIGVGASAVVVREDGRILMVQRSDNGLWLFPAGYADLGETVAHTAVREVREETNLHIVPERIIGVYSSPLFHHTYPNGHQVKNVGVLFRARLVDSANGLPQADGDEISSVAWMTPQEMLTRTLPAYRPYFEAALQHLTEGYFVT
ncbi:MAG: NUDIX domain-containing protein, partial [Anaerolineales bacterium]|nr:NUDIX domain-containing protein [Anaerolineales bacterium]